MIEGEHDFEYDDDGSFVCDGCGLRFNGDERAEEGEPYCLMCWEAMSEDA